VTLEKTPLSIRLNLFFENYVRGIGMDRLLIILFSPPWQSENTDTVYEFARAALEEGHEVTVFCDVDALYNLMTSQILPNVMTPACKMAKLIELGVQIHACGESARLRGVDPQASLIKGTIRSSLGRLAELMEKHDQIVAFG
jgi:sulfur relay (sulfurtransferase) complex TusBCD TusD component (DsrE family)